ncbi:MAG: type II toxin-antitoxin system VapC family toxin [Planctomycetes bacterium]|nr:type II toxin-antitoxin system VapC family toxin [Planctomycetota bacterium]
MNLVDSCGWMEFFGDGPNAKFFAPSIEDVEHLLVPSICIAEVVRSTLRQRTEEKAAEAAAHMERGLVIELDKELAVAAAEVSIETGLPMADSIILATARAYGATLWTQDAHFKDIEGVRYIEKRRKKP